MRNKSEEFGVCVDTERERKMDVFTTTAGDCCFLFTSLHLHLKIFLFLEKRFLVVFATCSTTSQPETDSQKTQKKRGRSRHILLSVVSRSPGKLFKRTLTYRGKRTQRYVKRERERKEEEAHFLLRLARVVVRTRGEKVARRRKEFSEQTTSA